MSLFERLGFNLNRAGSQPLEAKPASASSSFKTSSDMRGNLKSTRPPDPQRVILQAMRTNPFVRTVVSEPAKAGAQIPIYPVYGLRSGQIKRARPNGSAMERLAIQIWRGYADDCGSQENLVRRHFEAKRSTGELAQVRYLEKGRDGYAYEVLQNFPHIIERNRDKSYTWHQSPGSSNDRRILEGDARRAYNKDFEYTDKATSGLYPLVGLIAAWELVMKALLHGVEHDRLVSDFIVGPIDPLGGDDWTEDYQDWIAETQETGDLRLPFTLAIPGGGGNFKLIQPGETMQDGLIKIQELLTTELARYSGMDPKMILEGIGAGTHWNGILMERKNLSGFIWPIVRLEILPDLLAWPFRPALAAAVDPGTGNPIFDPMDWGLEADWQQVATTPDLLDKLTNRADAGVLSDAKPLLAMGIEESEIMEPGSPEWVRWEARLTAKARAQMAAANEFAVPPSREPVGVGGEVFDGTMPDNTADSSAMADPVERAGLNRAMTRNTERRLRLIDVKLQAAVLARADAALDSAAKDIDVEIKSRVDRAKLNKAELKAFDSQPFREFLGGLREPVRAALTRDEEQVARAKVAEAIGPIETLLERATAEVVSELDGVLDDTSVIADEHAADRPRAMEMFGTAMLAMTLGRLGRATNDDANRTLKDAVTPEGLARDTLEVAGGAATTPAGGLARATGGTPLTLQGELSTGSNLAQGHHVSAAVTEQLGLVPVRVFNHSGKADARSEHADADGKTEEELGGLVYPGGRDCGCSWSTEWRTP